MQQTNSFIISILEIEGRQPQLIDREAEIVTDETKYPVNCKIDL